MTFFKASRLKADVCQCVTHRTAEPTVSQFFQPKKVLLPLGFEGSIKEKGYTEGFLHYG